MTPPIPCPLLSSHPRREQGRQGGLGNPQGKQTREWWPSELLEAPSFRGKGWVALAPAPTPFPPRSSPSTHSISRGTWCYVLVLSFSLRGGRREGQPLREPLPWGSSEDGADTSWAVSPPPAHQDPPLAAVQLVPKHRNPQAGFGHTISCPPWPPLPYQWLFPMSGAPSGRKIPPIGNSPLALVEFIRPYAHPSICPGPHLAARHL